MDFIIREAQASDARGIASVHIQTWQSAYQGVVDQAYLDALTLEDRILMWKDLLQQREGLHLVALQADKIIGFCSAGLARHSSALDALNLDLSKMGEIYAIYILNEFQGQGIGKYFFKWCRNWFFKNHKTQFITWTFKDNLPAQKFYKNEGGTFLTQDISSINSQDYIENCFIFSLQSDN